ncbi:hypothetical protein FE773_06990 [Caminibacter mediatlanticus TB-2]|uniref:Uncharacterized protein n=1 Tax=Caminibacter mediatlanticus TB-2 TaxID=391592 RepID=A0AAI9AHH7_9BACT|nr:hypothetical protein [Caminibacter mediatlanticus]EDM24296.1 hypothetical protein CMTB2_02233 [Caminibacter mediatlanticus TB-2]QCT94941.1 hypothetical protein FE773_06990 [Caminibacter mediatlanticus TB-2]
MNEVHKNEVKILKNLLKSLETNENIEKNFALFLEDVKKYFNEVFIPWLRNHIETMDTVTAGFFDMVKATV